MLAGCGGEDEDPLTKREFVAVANSICTAADKEVVQRLSTYMQEQPNGGAGQTQAQLFAGAVEDILLPAAEGKIQEIGSLQPPPADERRIGAFLGEMEAGVEAVERTAPTYEPLKASLYEFEKRFFPAGRIAGEYGIDDCR